jgi:putative transcriptional regulator
MEHGIIRPGDFLLAMPALGGSYFHDSVIFVVEHGHSGSWGLVINNPVHIPLDEVFSRNHRFPRPPLPVDFALERPLHTFFFGGPVQGTAPFQNLSVCILEVGKSIFEGATEVSQGVFISRIPLSMELPVSMLIAPQNQTARMFFGYSGWGKGQLEREVAGGSWSVSTPFPLEVFSRGRDEIHVTVNQFREYHERFRA